MWTSSTILLLSAFSPQVTDLQVQENQMKCRKKERNGIDLNWKIFRRRPTLIKLSLFRFCRCLIICLGLFSYLTHCNDNMFSMQAVALWSFCLVQSGFSGSTSDRWVVGNLWVKPSLYKPSFFRTESEIRGLSPTSVLNFSKLSS